VFGVEAIEIVFFLIRFSLSLQSCMFNCSSSSFRGFVYIKKEAGFQPGLPGFRVDPPGRSSFAESTPHRVFI
jgi:hypothetical protein